MGRAGVSPALGGLVASAGALAATYAVSRGTTRGSRFDETALLTDYDGDVLGRVYEATSGVVQTVDRGALAVAAVLVLAIGAARRRWGMGILAFALIGVANVTTQVLKVGLERLDPFGTDALRAAPGAFPSGHSTVAMSVCCALILVAPAALRPVVAVLGGLYAAIIGASLLLLGAHYPSDVAGAFLLTAAYSAVAAAIAAQWRLDAPAPGVAPLRRGVAVALVLATGMAAALAVVAVAAVLRRPEVVEAGLVNRRFVLAAAVLVVAAFAVAAALVAQLAAAQRLTAARSPATARGTATPASGTDATARRAP